MNFIRVLMLIVALAASNDAFAAWYVCSSESEDCKFKTKAGAEQRLRDTVHRFDELSVVTMSTNPDLVVTYSAPDVAANESPTYYYSITLDKAWTRYPSQLDGTEQATIERLESWFPTVNQSCADTGIDSFGSWESGPPINVAPDPSLNGISHSITTYHRPVNFYRWVRDANGVCNQRIVAQGGWITSLKMTYCADPDMNLRQYPNEVRTCSLGTQAQLWGRLDTCSTPECREIVGNPINVISGEKFHRVVDGEVDGIPFSRIYTSDARESVSSFTRNWIHSFSTHLVGDLAYLKPDGGWCKLQPMGGSRGCQFEDSISVTNLPDGNRLVQNGSSYREVFGPDGFLKRREYMSGQVVDVIRDVENRITSLNFGTGRRIVFTYSGTVISEIDLSGFGVSYQYDQRGRLVRALYSNGGGELGYSYADQVNPSLLSSVTNELGQQIADYQYDSGGRAVRTKSGGQETTVSYLDSESKVLVRKSGAEYMYSINESGTKLLVGISSGENVAPETWGWNSNGMANTSRGQLRQVFTRNWPLMRLEKAVEEISGIPYRTTENVWHSTMPVIATQRLKIGTSGLIRTITKSYNPRGQITLLATSSPGVATPRQQRFTYCETNDVDLGACPAIGLLISTDESRTDVNDVTSYIYRASDDAGCGVIGGECRFRKGDLWKITDPQGHAKEYLAYNAGGRLVAFRDSNGVITELSHNSRGWLTTVKTVGSNGTSQHDNKVTSIAYYPSGLVERITLPDGSFTMYEYDASQQLTAVVDGEGNRTEYFLDEYGHVFKEDIKDADGQLRRTLSRIYNQLGQVVTQADAQSNPTDFVYDSFGNIDTVTDAQGRVADYNYDPLNRLVRTLQDVGGVAAETKFQYDVLGNLTRVTDPKGLDTTYTYNGLGDLVQLQSPDTGTTTYTYDSAGNRASQTDARGVTTTYQYDALNRLTQVGYPGPGLNVSYTYDATPVACQAGETFTVGRLTGMQDHSGTTQYCHDRFGNLVRKVQVTNGIAFVLRYAYTASGQLQGMTYPDGTVVDYVRNALGQVSEVGVTRVGQPRATLLHQATYHPFGPVAGWTYGNGRLMQRQVDQDYRPVSIQGGADGLDLTFGFDAVGNLTELASGSPPPLSHRYDALGRLTEVRHGVTQSVIDTYAYDKTGNRTSYTTTQGTDLYTYPANSHRLVDVDGVIRSYDAAGNTLAIGAAREFVYNDTGRMSQVKQAGVVTQQYAYNGRGEQVRRYLGAASTHALYDEAGHWVGDYDSAGNPIQQAIWMDDMPVGLLANGGQLHYVQPDHLGTPRAVIDPVRDVAVWAWDLKGEVFGNTPPEQDADGDSVPFVFDMRFPGQRYDPVSAISYNYLRDYDVSVGRYIESDPIGLSGGLGTYGYVGGAPLAWIDPHGLVRWQGTVSAVGAGYHGAGGAFLFKLESQCVNGRRARVTIRAWGLGAGEGLKHTPPVGMTESNVTLEDHLPDINIQNLNGLFVAYSAGLTAGPASYSCSAYQIGSQWTPAVTPWSGVCGAGAKGFEAGGSMLWGKSKVVSSVFEKCDACEPVNSPWN